MLLFGDVGLQNQLGAAEYARPRKFREKLQRWLDLVRTLAGMPGSDQRGRYRSGCRVRDSRASQGGLACWLLTTLTADLLLCCAVKSAHFSSGDRLLGICTSGTGRVRGDAQPAVLYRQIAMYLAKNVGGWSAVQIGRFYNGRDHSTVCHAVTKIEALRLARPDS